MRIAHTRFRRKKDVSASARATKTYKTDAPCQPRGWGSWQVAQYFDGLLVLDSILVHSLTSPIVVPAKLP